LKNLKGRGREQETNRATTRGEGSVVQKASRGFLTKQGHRIAKARPHMDRKAGTGEWGREGEGVVQVKTLFTESSYPLGTPGTEKSKTWATKNHQKVTAGGKRNGGRGRQQGESALIAT